MKKSKSLVEIRELSSKLLDKRINYCVILPAAYRTKSALKFPVLYLLHGLFGRFDNWLTHTKIIDYAREFSFIIVCADGGDNWYSDNPSLINHHYENYFFEELIPEIEQNFPVTRRRNSRAVAGLSMGGYGAFKFALHRPEMFCLAASMSGAFHAAEVFDDAANENWKEIHESIFRVFGKTDNELRAKNNLAEMAQSFPAEKISRLPFFYFNCGLKDSFLPVNRHLAEIFRQRRIAHEFRIFNGGHDWIYWDKHINSILNITAQNFRKSEFKNHPRK